jgi:hypothetical protein
MGVLPGVPDIVLFYRREFYGLELKAANGRPTEAQLAFMANLDKQGGYGCISYSTDSALKVLKNWGLLL